MQARRRAQPSGTNSPSSSHPRLKAPSAMRHLLSVPAMRPPGSPRRGVPGRLHREAAGERPPRARPQRRGSPGPIPNPAVKPAFAESTAARGCGRAGRRARGGRFSTCAPFERRPSTGRRSPLPVRARGCAPAEAGGVRRTRRERPAGGSLLRASLRFADIAVLHRSRAKHAPQIPEGVVPLAGPSLVLGRLRHRERRCARCRQVYASRGPGMGHGLCPRVR